MRRSQLSCPPSPLSLSKKGLIGLVYVAIAIVAVGASTVMANGNVQWFTSSSQLTVDIQRVELMINTESPVAQVYASVHNPTGFGGLRLSDVGYGIFANSTTASFSYQGNSEVGNGGFLRSELIPPLGTLNITFSVPIYPEVLLSLQDFVSTHQADFTTIVGVTINLNSSFGSVLILYCYQMPGQSFTICPSSRVLRTRFGA